MQCPICEGTSTLKIETTLRTFRKQEFQIFEHYYECENCQETYSTDELDTLNVNQVYNQYRETTNTPFPEQIISFRESFNLSSSLLSKILGFGPNGIRKYENGEIPSPSNATLLNMVINDFKAFNNLVLSKKELLGVKDKVDNLLKVIREKIDDKIKDCEGYQGVNLMPDQYSGFKLLCFSKFANMSIFFLAKLQPFLFYVKLNKLLFYSDFLHFKRNGYSISGSTYHAIPKGPVPRGYGFLFEQMKKENLVQTKAERVETSNFVDYFERLEPIKEFDRNLFTDSELEVLELVLDKFGYEKTDNVIEISHQEIAWIQNEKKMDNISYQDYAFLLKAF